ncbi:hypothetical protein [uncultured Mycobacterium sp.]|uniref:hypothetical protein n=1 Tax=uncultured Mycobacterium sp. TaxID=171292 RepID=UPI0035C9ABF5
MISYRVVWVPGADQLLGVCHCGAEQIAEDPVQLWAWLTAHPEGHHAHAEASPPRRVRAAAVV